VPSSKSTLGNKSNKEVPKAHSTWLWGVNRQAIATKLMGLDWLASGSEGCLPYGLH